MSFLQPLILAALPLMALPIVIHLIHQQRHRSVHWAAMMFLVSAKRMNRGMARLRYLLIMVARMAMIGALIFAISRPLASGFLGGIGMGKPDATIVLLDRSASMEALDLQTGESKRSTALKKLTELLDKRGFGNHLLLIDSATEQPQVLDSPKALLDLPNTSATATSAHIPGMLEQSLTYLKANETGRADVWICSDLNESDWDTSSGRWAAIREQFTELKGVQHFLLSYADRPAGNLSVRVQNIKRRQRDNRSELVVDVLLESESQVADSSQPSRRVPVEFDINGVKSMVEIELEAGVGSLQGHSIPIDSKLRSGWGSVGLPADTNPQDNRFYFVFSEPPVREAVIVTDDPRSGEAFRLGLAIPRESGLEQHATVLPSARVAEIDWQNTAMLIWQAPEPSGRVAEQLQRFVDTGRVVLFFPHNDSQWRQLSQEAGKVSWWRGDADLLAHVDSGDPLPLDELRVYQYASWSASGEDSNASATLPDVWLPTTVLAKLEGELPLLSRAATDRGGVYFCNTLPTAQFSSLQRDAVAYYVLLQRALADGSRSMAPASQRHASADVLADRTEWKPVAPVDNLSTVSQRGLHAGVYRDGEYWAGINRSLAEDNSNVASLATIDALFDGLSYQRIDDAVGDTSSLATEIWRMFLIAMWVALIVEAALCLSPKRIEEKQLGFKQVAKVAAMIAGVQALSGERAIESANDSRPRSGYSLSQSSSMPSDDHQEVT